MMMHGQPSIACSNRRESRLRIPGRCAARRNRSSPQARAALTLLEVLLALAIFAGSWAALGQLLSNGVRGSVQSQLQTHAMLRCESRLAEIVAGAVPFQAVSEVPFEDDPAWTWSATLTPHATEGLYEIEVTVSRAGSGFGGTSFALKRLGREPEIFTAAPTTATTGGTAP